MRSTLEHAVLIGALSFVPQLHAQPVVGTQASKPIANQFIVVFKEGTSDAPGLGRQMASQVGGQFLHGYSHTVRGFALRLPAHAASRAVQAL